MDMAFEFGLRVLRLCILMSLCMLAVLPSAARPEPLPAPRSPETLASLPASLRDDPRAWDGAVALGGYDTLSCSEGVLMLNYALIVPPEGDHAVTVRVTVRQGDVTFMNTRIDMTVDSGVYTLPVVHDNSGGSATDAFPLSGAVLTVVSMLLLADDDEPLWFSELLFYCDGVPDLLVTNDGPVTVTLVNPDFDAAGATNKLAQKWTLSKGTSRSCSVVPGECVLKLKSNKPDKSVLVSQKRKIKNSHSAAADPYGFVVVFDASADASGSLVVAATFYDAESSAEQSTSLSSNINAGQQEREISYGLRDETQLDFPIKASRLTISRSDVSTGEVYVRRAYIWVADQLN